MPVSLDQILSSTRDRLPALRAERTVIEREAAASATPPSLHHALVGSTVAVIAEVKRRSPSAGAIREDLHPITHAKAYAAAGAAAVSVLTDGPFFGGSLDDLRDVVAWVDVPVLRKDFILDELQVLEARAAGASAVLLIVRALEKRRLRELLTCAADLDLDPLVEVHTLGELETALEADAGLVGINSRDLDTFAIDTTAAWGLLERVPPGVIAIAESGMTTASDVAAAAGAGADAVLIGTALSAAADPAGLLKDLTGIRRHAR